MYRGEAKNPEYLASLAGKTGIDRLKHETEKREEELAKQVKIGQRVLVQIKKSSTTNVPRQCDPHDISCSLRLGATETNWASEICW